MRVLMTTDTVGGAWTFAQELAKGLLECGCAIYLVSFGRKPAVLQQAECDDLARTWREKFHYEGSEVPLEWMDCNERAYEDGASALLRLAADFQPDFLLSSQFCFGALPLPVPKIVVAHSDVLSWAKACRNKPLPDSPWLRRYCELVARGIAGASAVVAPTRWMLDALASNFTLPGNALVIPNGRSIPEASSSQRKLEAITAGRLWDKAKNLSMLHGVRLPIPLLIAGEGLPSATPNAIFPSGSTFLGPLSSRDLLHHFRESSIYICASRYEPFGLAPLEAALCGCAVVANDIPSLREVWNDGALYFSNAEDLSRLLNLFLASPEQLRAAQIRSLQRAGTFTTARMADSYFQMFHAIVAHSREAFCAA